MLAASSAVSCRCKTTRRAERDNSVAIGREHTLWNPIGHVVAIEDNVGVKSIQLFVNGNLSGSAAASPATFTWDTRTLQMAHGR